jgi:hypothetical protein
MKNALKWIWETAVFAYFKQRSRYIKLEQLRGIMEGNALITPGGFFSAKQLSARE